ncbi:hypothetical protein ACRAWD_32110 [Caulobacter segnis]
MSSGPRRWLERANPLAFTLFAGLAGFCAYFSMYAFRKPFAAATFSAWSRAGILRSRITKIALSLAAQVVAG